MLILPDLALLAVSSLISTTFSIIQQGNDITWYAEIVTTQFERKQGLPSNDPEAAISGGSSGVDLVLYYIRKCQLPRCVDEFKFVLMVTDRILFIQRASHACHVLVRSSPPLTVHASLDIGLTLPSCCVGQPSCVS